MRVSWILFDAGNTLIGLDYGKVIGALRASGCALSAQDLRRGEAAARAELDAVILEAWSAGEPPRTGWIEAGVWKDFWARAVRHCGVPAQDAARMAGAILEVTRPASSWDRVAPETPEALDDLLQAGYRLGVISNSNGTVAAQLEQLGLGSRFEFIVDSAAVGVEKPHPAIFHHALARAGGVAADEALYVGDVYAIDVLGAVGAGLRAALFDPDSQWDAARHPGKPRCARVTSLREVRALVDRDPES